MSKTKLSLVTFLVTMVAPVLLWAAPYEADEQDGVRIVLLSPQDGAALNAAALHVQVLAAAYQNTRNSSFIFHGQSVPGRNAGRVRELDAALDGKVIERLDTRRWGAQLVADFRLDISRLSPGAHTVAITAYPDNDEDHKPATASATFTIDRSLNPPALNRIEDAATPQPFGGFSVGGADGNGEQDGEHDRNWPWRPAGRFNGQFVLGHLSDGVDFSQDRIILSLGPLVQAIEPGTLQCKRRGDEGQVCTFEDRSGLLMQSVEFRQGEGGGWTFKLESAQVRTAANFYIRIGDDWGGIDLRTGERLVGLDTALDTSRRAQAVIGPNGGRIQTTDAAGILIGLQVPAGALTKDTLITMTPLASSPLPDASSVLQPGVQFEPDGLRFAQPATLTLDFSVSRESVNPASSIFLLTSPLTTLPLFGTANPSKKTVTALLYHFSSTDAGSANSAFVDLAAWGNKILQKAGLSTLSELQSEAALMTQQQLNPDLCLSQKCLDPNAVTRQVQASLNALGAAACTKAMAAPSIAELDRLLSLEGLGSLFNVLIAGNRNCEEQVLKTLIDAAGKAALADPPNVYTDPNADRNDPALITLLPTGSPTNQTLADFADNLGFGDLISLYQTYFAAALQARINRTGDLADTATLNEDLYNQRLQALQGIAGQMGLSSLVTLALQRLDQAIKNQASRDVATAQQLGTDAAKQSAITDLQREISVVSADPALAQYDPALQPLLQEDVKKLQQGPPMTVVIRSQLEEGECCNQSASTWVGAYTPFGVRGRPVYVYAADNSAPPVTLNVSAPGGGSFTSTLSQPDRSTLAWDIMGQGRGDAVMYVELTVPVKGTLQFQVNPQVYAPPLLRQYTEDWAQWQPLTTGAVAFGECVLNPTNHYLPLCGGLSLPVNAGKIGLYVRAGGTDYISGYNSVGAINAVGSLNGRLFTVTFKVSQ